VEGIGSGIMQAGDIGTKRMLRLRDSFDENNSTKSFSPPDQSGFFAGNNNVIFKA
jgi:hypothetical protein